MGRSFPLGKVAAVVEYSGDLGRGNVSFFEDFGSANANMSSVFVGMANPCH